MRTFGLVLLWATLGCGGATVNIVDLGTEVSDAPVEARSFSGSVVFEYRTPTPRGLSREIEQRPAPVVLLRALDRNDEVVAETFTTENGTFSVEATTAVAAIEVVASSLEGDMDLAVVTDQRGEALHRLAFPLDEITSSSGELEIVARDDVELSGALHILEQLRFGWQTVKAWTHESLPPFFITWSRGRTTNWSFYTGEVADTGRYRVELLGGQPRARRGSDTDEHDECIILHEFGHFVFDLLSTSSSHGGSHSGDMPLEPGLAWEEGRATWFAAALRGHPWYDDTSGIEPGGSLLVHHDLERGAPGKARGIGGELGIAEILWDLADGDGHLPDVDNDGVALGALGVLAAMRRIVTEDPGAYVTIQYFLRSLVEHGDVTEEALVHMLNMSRQPPELVTGTGTWSTPITVGQTAEGIIDVVSNPGPSGGEPRPTNGLDAVRVFRFEVTEPGFYSAILQSHGVNVRDNTPIDLDLELRDIRADLIANSFSPGPDESVITFLQTGHYLLYVRDGSGSSRGQFELTLLRR